LHDRKTNIEFTITAHENPALSATAKTTFVAPVGHNEESQNERGEHDEH